MSYTQGRKKFSRKHIISNLQGPAFPDPMKSPENVLIDRVTSFVTNG